MLAAAHEEPGRLDEAQRVVASRAPQLQRILNQALQESEYFGSAHQEQLLQAAGVADPDARVDAVARLGRQQFGVLMPEVGEEMICGIGRVAGLYAGFVINRQGLVGDPEHPGRQHAQQREPEAQAQGEVRQPDARRDVDPCVAQIVVGRAATLSHRLPASCFLFFDRVRRLPEKQVG